VELSDEEDEDVAQEDGDDAKVLLVGVYGLGFSFDEVI
jgi:hypothetical protein